MAAPMFTANPHRHDPYRTFKFQVSLGDQAVAGLSKMGALKKTTQEVKWRTAGDPAHERVLPGGTSYDPVTLEQGLTHDLVFEEWANLVNNIDGDGAMSLLNYRRNVTITVMNLQGVPVMGYTLKNAWVSEFQAVPDLDAGTMNTVGIQTITIQHEGWVRDAAVVEPTEE